MPASTATLQLTDDTTTANLVDGTNYSLVAESWAPSVSPRRTSLVGGKGPYEDAEEIIEVNCLGSDAATALSNLAKLSQLLDQADRWNAGEDVSAVKIKAQPQGSTLAAALQAVVLGRSGNSALIGLPRDITDTVGIGFAIEDVGLKFLRRGQWIGADSASSTSSAAEVANVMSATFSDNHLVSSPVKLTLSGFDADKITNLTKSVILIAPTASRLVIVEGEAGATGVKYLSTAATTARGGNVVRYTPTDTNNSSATAITLTGLSSSVKRIGIFAAVKNSSVTTTWRMYVTSRSGTTLSEVTISTPEIVIDGSNTNPQIVYLGSLASDFGHASLQITLRASDISGSPTFDIDYLAVIGLDDEYSRVIALDATDITSHTGICSLIINDRILTHPTPRVTIDENVGGDQIVFSYRGDLMLASKGTSIAAAWLAVGGNSNNHWRFTDNTNTVISLQLSATRHTAYLTPQ